MLTITPTAAEVIENVIASSTSAASSGGGGEAPGLRITHQAGEDSQVDLALAIVPAPEAGDQVVEGEGAQVYLPPDTAALLDDKVLDARVEGERVGFELLEARA